MYNKVELAKFAVPMYRLSTDCETYEYRASIGPRTDVTIVTLKAKKKEIINIYIRGESARVGGRVCAYNNTTKEQKQIYFTAMPRIEKKKRAYEPGRQPAAVQPASTYGRDERYHTPAWRQLRLVILEREPICRSCRYEDRISRATQIDHIRPVTAGGNFYDAENLQPLCASCHSSKSAKEGNQKR